VLSDIIPDVGVLNLEREIREDLKCRLPGLRAP